MKKTNRNRQMLLQKKRTKRNASRKGKTYNPRKVMVQIPQMFVADGSNGGVITDESKLVL